MEKNLIQRPELLARLGSYLGLRQAHIAPTLNEGVQAVIVVGSITESDASAGGSSVVSGTEFERTFLHYMLLNCGGAQAGYRTTLHNPAGSGVLVHPIELHHHHWHSGALWIAISVDTLVPGGAGVAGRNMNGAANTGGPGTRLSSKAKVHADYAAGIVGGAGEVWAHEVADHYNLIVNLQPWNITLAPGESIYLRNIAGADLSCDADHTWVWTETQLTS